MSSGRRWSEAWPPLVVAAAVALIQGFTFSRHLALGDSPEYAGSIHALGNLHAPGYPSYVILGRIFTTLLPGLGAVLEVHLFSVTCAVVAAVLVQRIGRQAGAGPWASAIAAIGFAVGTSTWFYGGYAKHYALASALSAGAILLFLRWTKERRPRDLLGAAALVGLLGGAGWPFSVLLLLAFVSTVVISPVRITVRDAALAVGIAAAAVVAVYGFSVARATQEPAFDWGHPTSVSRIGALLTMEDFGFGIDAIGRSDGGPGAGNGVNGKDLSSLPRRVGTYAEMSVSEEGAGLLLAAAIGIVVLARSKRRRPHTVLLATLFIGNVLVAGLVVGPRRSNGFETVLKQGGYLHTEWIALAALAAVGLTAGASFVARRAPRRPVVAAAAALAVLGILVPSVVVHGRAMDRRQVDLADEFVRIVFSEVPKDGVLVVFTAELTFPLRYAQVVEGRRPDIDIVVGGGLGRQWYRQSIRKAVGSLPVATGDTRVDATQGILALAQRRTVYVDPVTAEFLRASVGYRPAGYLAKVVTGQGAQPIADVGLVRRRLRQATRAVLSEAKDVRGFPNELMMATLARANVELARADVDAKRWDEARRDLRAAIRLEPRYNSARRNLALIDQADPG
jgi:hypothetical protein